MNRKPVLRIIDGGRDRRAAGDRIAISLVHRRKRLDIPANAIIRVEAFATQTFSDGRGPVTFDIPHVEIWLTPNMCEKLRDLTCDIIDEAMEVIVGGDCISRPAVREPLGTEPSFQLSANAQALANKLRAGWRPAGPRRCDSKR